MSCSAAKPYYSERSPSFGSFQQALNLQGCIGACPANITYLFAYLGWLGRKTFGIQWGNVNIVKPMDDPTLGLLVGIGILMVNLLPQTKLSQSATTDVIATYHTASGLKLGLWGQWLQALLPATQLLLAAFILAYAKGWPWNSDFYWYTTYLYPVLFLLCSLGDPYLLSKYNESPGWELIIAFWLFNTMRGSAWPVVAKKQPETLQAHTPLELVEHGCWRLSGSSLDTMPLAYLEMSTQDQL